MSRMSIDDQRDRDRTIQNQSRKNTVDKKNKKLKEDCQFDYYLSKVPRRIEYKREASYTHVTKFNNNEERNQYASGMIPNTQNVDSEVLTHTFQQS